MALLRRNSNTFCEDLQSYFKIEKKDQVRSEAKVISRT